MSQPKRRHSDWHPFVRQVVADKIRGAMLGSALGDCIGLYTEFLNKTMSKDAYPDGKFKLTGDVTRFCNDSHRNKFSEGSWTDDTDHCLLIILSFLQGDGTTLSSQDFAVRLRTWIEQGLRCLNRLPLGLGRVIGSVVSRRNYLDDPKAAAYTSWANSSFTSAPNGSLMRTYPLGIMCLDKSLEETFEVAADFSLVTHADPRCVVSCCIATAIIRNMLLAEIKREEDIDTIVDKAASYVESLPPYSPESMPTEVSQDTKTDEPGKSPPPLDREELYKHTKAVSYSGLELDDLRKLGYVYKCLGSSILCLRLAMRRSSTYREATSTVLPSHLIFEDLITDLTMEGGDADTNGAVAGAFLGCYLGFNMLPPHWYDGLQHADWLLTKADAVIQVLDVEDCAVGYVGRDDPDTQEDGGQGLLDRAGLEAREKAFMEMYLMKTLDKKGGSLSGPQKNSGGQGLMKRWKDVFG